MDGQFRISGINIFYLGVHDGNYCIIFLNFFKKVFVKLCVVGRVIVNDNI